ncbi:MAG TPA: DUF3299 domain-containing protein, partial [Tepidisphaeraceae bacterium]
MPGKVQEMTIKELGNFDYNPDKGGIPDDVKRLSGSTIRLKGYMIPLYQAAHITHFALVPSLFSCCFGQPPQVQHTIVCSCPNGKAISYDPDQIVVEGKLSVEEKRDDGYVTSIFQLEPKSVTEVLAAAAKQEIPTAPGERKIHAPIPAGQVAQMSIKELGNFDYDPDKGGIPDDVKKLSGCKIRLTGFMI